MNYISLLEELIPIYEDTTYNINKINVYMDSIFREYLIEKEESELKVLKESASNEELENLYQEAKTNLGNKVDLSVKKLVTSVKTFDAKVSENVRTKFKSGETTRKLKKAEEKLKKNPKSGKAKVEIIDVESEIKNIEKTIDELHKLAMNNADENNIGKLMDDANDINTSCQKERKRLDKSPIECQVAMVLPILKKRVISCSKEIEIDKYFIPVKSEDSVQKKQLVTKINGLIAQLLKEKKSVLYAGVNDAYKKIMKSKYKEVKENAMEYLINELDKYFPENTQFLTEALLQEEYDFEEMYESVYEYTLDLFYEDGDENKDEKEAKKKQKELKKQKKSIKRKIAKLMVIIGLLLLALKAIDRIRDQYKYGTDNKDALLHLKSVTRYRDNMTKEDINKTIKDLYEEKKSLESIASSINTDEGNDFHKVQMERNKRDTHYYKAQRLLVEVENDLKNPIKKILTNVYLPTKYRNKINLAYQHYEKAVYGETINTTNHMNTDIQLAVNSASRKVDKNVSKLMRKGKTKYNEFKNRRNG